MPYNSLIDRANDAIALIPAEYEEQIIQAIPEASAIMSLGRRLRDMGRHERTMRVVDGLATAYFVGTTTAASGDTGRIQTSDMSWTNEVIRAAKIGAIVPIPKDVLEDVDYDLWGEIKPQLTEAFGRVVDAAVIYGTSAPTDWPDDLVTGATAHGNLVSLAAFTDLYDALLSDGGAVAKVEENGYMVSGHVSHMSMRSKLRGARDSFGQPLFTKDPTSKFGYTLDGEACTFPKNGVINPALTLDICGDWSQLVYAMRKGLTFEVLTEASIHDNNGTLQYNLAQDDMVALKAVMRMGWQLPTPPNRLDATPYPFAVLAP